MINKYIYIFLFTVLLYSCAVGPDFHEPETNVPQEFRFANKQIDSLINLKWWEIFDDPILDTLIVTALRENKDVLIAASRIDQAKANVGYYKADYGPKVGMNASVGKSNIYEVVHVDDPLESYSAFGVVNWELDFWGKYRRSTEAARANLLATYYGKRSVELELISEVAKNYFRLLDYKTRLQIAENTLKIRDTALQIIQKRFDKGYTNLLEVDQSVIQKSVAQVSIPNFKKLIAFSENNLSVLMGKFPDSIVTPINLLEVSAPISIPVGIPSDILKRRPDILQALQLYKAQNAKIGVAEAMRFPSISLTGLLGLTSNDLSNLVSDGLGWSAGAGLVGPLFEWGKNARRVDIEREKAKQSLFKYENVVLNAFREVDNSLITVSSLKDILTANKLASEAASNAGHLSRQRYYQGVTSYLEVIETQRQEFEIQLSLSKNYQELLSAYVQLYKTLGGGWITEEELDQYLSESQTDETGYSGQIIEKNSTEIDSKTKRKQEKARRKAEKEQGKNK